jgi:hypothetical protein
MIRTLNRTHQIFREQLITTFHTNLWVCGTRLVSAYSHKILADTTHIQNKIQKGSTYSKEATAAHEHRRDTRGLAKQVKALSRRLEFRNHKS